jgi:hypothetical protein
VIPGAENDAGDARQPREVPFHDDDLGAEIDGGSDVERIAGEDDEIELRSRAEQPVELRQRVVQIRDDQTTQRSTYPNAEELLRPMAVSKSEQET